MRATTADHIRVVQAAHAAATEQPDYALTLLGQCEAPLEACLDLLVALLKERARDEAP